MSHMMGIIIFPLRIFIRQKDSIISLRKADILKRLSPKDLLEEFSKVYIVKVSEREMISEVPKKVVELEKLLSLNDVELRFEDYGCDSFIYSCF